MKTHHPPVTPVVASFRLEPRDLARASLRVQFPRPKRWIVLAVAFALLLVLAVVQRDFGTSDALRTTAMGAAVVLLVVLLFGLRARGWRRLPNVGDEQTRTFSATGIHIKKPVIDNHLHWSIFTDIVETRELVLFKHNRHLVNIVPRRAFASPGDEERFSQLAMRHPSQPHRPGCRAVARPGRRRARGHA